ncbi:MAG TPA: 6-O-methylguanine DNA methyltransferase [Paucimonas sp.]|nr:6-O-methylguanine DNA methyltransferase [Paucimonas sp.]
MAGAFKTKRSAREKLDAPQERRLVDIPAKDVHRFGPGKMLIPCPRDIDAAIREIKRGKLLTTQELRDELARRHGAQTACPLVTGIFVRVCAEAAEEDRSAGKKRIAPYWRVVREDGGLLEKIPGGAEAQAQYLQAEGHTIEGKPGKGAARLRVAGFRSR